MGEAKRQEQSTKARKSRTESDDVDRKYAATLA